MVRPATFDGDRVVPAPQIGSNISMLISILIPIAGIIFSATSMIINRVAICICQRIRMLAQALEPFRRERAFLSVAPFLPEVERPASPLPDCTVEKRSVFRESLVMAGWMIGRQALKMPRVGSRSVKSPSGARLYVMLCMSRSVKYLMRRIEMMQS